MLEWYVSAYQHNLNMQIGGDVSKNDSGSDGDSNEKEGYTQEEEKHQLEERLDGQARESETQKQSIAAYKSYIDNEARRTQKVVEGMKEQQAKQVSELKNDHEKALEQTRENFQQTRREMHARYVTSIALERVSAEEAASAQINELQEQVKEYARLQGEWEVERASLMSKKTASAPNHNNGCGDDGDNSSSSPLVDMEDNSSRASSTTFVTIATSSTDGGNSSNTSIDRDTAITRATPPHLTTTMHYPQSLVKPEEEEIDVEDFTNKWGVWRSFVELQKHKEKKPLRVRQLDRHDVIMPLFEVLGVSGGYNLKSLCNLYRPMMVAGFKGEEVLDYGGATYEVFSLFFEQLQEASAVVRVGGRGQAGFDMSFQLFNTVGGGDNKGGGGTGTTFLPTAVVEEEIAGGDDSSSSGGNSVSFLFQAIQNTPAVKQMYFDVGRVMAKAIIEGCPIPPCWASDFLIGFLLDEEPHQSRVTVSRLLHMLVEIDPSYMWLLRGWRSGQIPFEGMAVEEVLLTPHHGGGSSSNNDWRLKGCEGMAVGPENWEDVLRQFFISRSRVSE